MRDLIRKVLGRLYLLASPKSISTSLSDNQAYPDVCLRASNEYRIFNNFRRDPVYKGIVEQVTREQGIRYLEVINRDSDVLSAMEAFKENDRYGSPIMYDYPPFGAISPTTLRYVKVLGDLKRHFGILDGLNICEIGVGYGGQCRIINAFYRPATYCLVDIKPALNLAQRFLDNYALASILTYKTMNELDRHSYDLVISNYAFTELPRRIQDVYLGKIIVSSRRGYITYNEITPQEFGSYRAHELIRLIPGSTATGEEPLTHPKNCIILWGQRSA